MKLHYWQLQQRQSLPLEKKIILSKIRIRDWYEYYHGNVYVSFSGGKDSTVLLHLVRSLYPDVPAVFVDTGLEYPEIKSFVKKINNVVWIHPELPFHKVIEKYGYPVISKKISRMIHVCRNPSISNQNTRKLYLCGISRKNEKTHSFKLPKKWRKLLYAPFKISDKCCDELKKKPFQKYVKETGRKGITGVMASDGKQRE
jgi:3'-phosphoadenosine 5'-phosphosulfate sulfotransferase (PAPS reductase)/FAD synthetase